MSSQNERHAAVIWTLADALCLGSTDATVVERLRQAVDGVSLYVRHDWDTDRAMRRAGERLRCFVRENLRGPDGERVNVRHKDLLAYCHMLSVLASDMFSNIHREKNIPRFNAWLLFCNELATLINLLAGPGNGMQVERGVRWANEVTRMLASI